MMCMSIVTRIDIPTTDRSEDMFFIVDSSDFALRLDPSDASALETFSLSYLDIVVIGATASIYSQYDAIPVKDHVEGELYTLLDSYNERGVDEDNYNAFMHVIQLALRIAWPISNAVHNLQRQFPHTEIFEVDVLSDGTIMFRYQ